jgi:hypothetical protein
LSQAARVLRSAFALLLVVSVASPSRAEATDVAIRFQYAAPPECPDAAAFAARVRQRTSRGRLAEPGELARTFDVGVMADANGFSGQIEFLDDGGVKVNRQLHGEQCDAVVSSLALITALALDATLREAEPEPPAEPPRAPVKTPPPAQPRPLAKVPAEAIAAWSPAREPHLLQARVGIGGALSTVLDSPRGDSVAPRIGLFGQLEWRNAVALRLTAHVDALDFTVDEGRRAKVRILAVETSFCPWFLRSGAVGFYPCGVLDLGSLRAEGERGDKLTTAGSDAIVWASVGLEARLLFDFSTLPLWVELSGSAGFPLVATHRFQFQRPIARVYEVPRFPVATGVAFGVRFW